MPTYVIPVKIITKRKNMEVIAIAEEKIATPNALMHFDDAMTRILIKVSENRIAIKAHGKSNKFTIDQIEKTSIRVTTSIINNEIPFSINDKVLLIICYTPNPVPQSLQNLVVLSFSVLQLLQIIFLLIDAPQEVQNFTFSFTS